MMACHGVAWHDALGRNDIVRVKLGRDEVGSLAVMRAIVVAVLVSVAVVAVDDGVSTSCKGARHDTTRHGTTRHDTTRHGTARHGTARHRTFSGSACPKFLSLGFLSLPLPFASFFSAFFDNGFPSGPRGASPASALLAASPFLAAGLGAAAAAAAGLGAAASSPVADARYRRSCNQEGTQRCR